MKRVFIAIVMAIASFNVHAKTELGDVTLGFIDSNDVVTLDIRYREKVGRALTHLSFSFLGGSKRAERFNGIMLGAGAQFPAKRNAPYFYGVGAYFIFAKNNCKSFDPEDPECQGDTNSIFDGKGSDLALYPEIGMRFNVARNHWLTTSARYYFTTADELDHEFSLNVGWEF